MKFLTELEKKEYMRQIGGTKKDLLMSSQDFLNKRGWDFSWYQSQTNEWNLFIKKNLAIKLGADSELRAFVYGFTLADLDLDSLNSYFADASSTQEFRLELQNYPNVLSSFENLVHLKKKVLSLESRVGALGRARLIYASYLKKSLTPRFEQIITDLVPIYEQKVEIEQNLLATFRNQVEELIFAVKTFNPIYVDSLILLPFITSFLFLYLERQNSHWYYFNGEWLYFSGSIKVVSMKSRVEFESFLLGMALRYAFLSEESIEQVKKYR